MHPDYAKAVGRFAYVWSWPLVNMWNRRAGITQAPAPGRLGGGVPVAPQGRIGMLNDYVLPDQSFVACPNQDVAYGLGYFSLDEEPVVIQVPDFGDRFWVYALYDARTDQFGELGKAYGSAPGFYLLVGPNWDGEVPDGINEVFRSPTELAMAGPRVFLDDTDEDRATVKAIVNQIDAYPLTEFDGVMKVKDSTKASRPPTRCSAWDTVLRDDPLARSHRFQGAVSALICGTQAGAFSCPGWSVSRAMLEPSALTTKTSVLPCRSDWNAIMLLSGDQLGSVSLSGQSISRVSPEPSAPMTWSSCVGEAVLRPDPKRLLIRPDRGPDSNHVAPGRARPRPSSSHPLP